MNKIRTEVYRSPLSPGYWKTARADFHDARYLVIAAMMIAACLALSYIPSIRLWDGNVRVTWGFLARSVCGLICGPITALVFGFAEDTISYLMHSSDPYFPGYALTTMLGTLIYALFLYRTKPTVWKVFLAKFFTNVLNVTLGALWSAILYNKGYLYYAGKSLIKNVVMLPVQTVMLCVLLAALLPILARMKIIPKEMGKLTFW